jgi:hypothetical protein
MDIASVPASKLNDILPIWRRSVPSACLLDGESIGQVAESEHSP